VLRPTHRLLLAAWLAWPLAARADSLRCDGGIVSVGDLKLDLIGKCGFPALKEEQEVERSRARFTAGGQLAAGRSALATVERWTYNFGPRQFVQVVTLEGGKVTAIERGSYGYDLGRREEPPPIPRTRCDQLAFSVGDTTFDVLARCGEPALRDVALVTRSAGGWGGGGAFETTTVSEYVELWTYDLGPQSLVRRLTIAGGKVVRVETGSYGYSR
jgi:hypothetical protein